MKNYSRKEFERILIDNGYSQVRKNGDHIIWKKDNVQCIAVPRHRLNFMICKRLIKKNNLIL